jgi:hypothetical protein
MGLLMNARVAGHLVAVLAASIFLGNAVAAPMSVTEQAVIAAVLNQTVQTPPQTMVINSHSVPLSEGFRGRTPTASALKKRFPFATKAVIKDLLRLANQRAAIQIPPNLVDPDASWIIVDSNILTTLTSGTPSPWRPFYDEYSTEASILRFSRIGIDPKSRQALFYVSSRAGGLTGIAHLILLEEIDGVWQFQRSRQLWVQ